MNGHFFIWHTLVITKQDDNILIGMLEIQEIGFGHVAIDSHLSLKVMVRTIDALQRLLNRMITHSGRGWEMWGRRGTSRHYFPRA